MFIFLSTRHGNSVECVGQHTTGAQTSRFYRKLDSFFENISDYYHRLESDNLEGIEWKKVGMSDDTKSSQQRRGHRPRRRLLMLSGRRRLNLLNRVSEFLSSKSTTHTDLLGDHMTYLWRKAVSSPASVYLTHPVHWVSERSWIWFQGTPLDFF
jgi:hypothetical protein